MEIDLGRDIDSMKKEALVKYVRELVAHIKGLTKKEQSLENEENLPYDAVSVVGKKFVTLKFDLESGKAKVVDVKTDTRDIRNNNMAVYYANHKLLELGKKQKEKEDEKN
jgi:hypothetical protein